MFEENCFDNDDGKSRLSASAETNDVNGAELAY